MEQLATNYNNSSLSELAQQIDADFYEPIKLRCKQAAAQLAVMADKESLGHLHDLVDLKQQTLLTYIAALAKKTASGHDCSTCSGGCDMGHVEHLMNIRESHMTINSHLAAIDINEKPDDLLQLASLLTNLVRIEEHVLVSKILEAQKKINVAG